jgi:DNA-binding NarL/FixJ family response regulator
MVTDAVKELQAAKAKVAALEQSLAKELKQKLANLPSEYGFDSLPAFIKALKDVSGAPRPGRKPGKVAGTPGKPAKRSKRARLTPELKNEVKAAVAAGKTGAAIAKEFGISVPSVQNIKKEFGLVKKRG